MDVGAYDQFAELDEDHWWFRARRTIFFHLLERLLPLPGHGRRPLEIVDVGCGAGGLTTRLARFGRARGLEPYREIAALARERTGLPILCGSAYDIPLSDDSQDLACLFDTIEHIPDEKRALAEVFRIVRPGGLAFLSVPAYAFLWTNNDDVAHHQRRYTRGALRRALEGAGFEPLRLTYFNTLLFPAIVPALLLQRARERWIGLRDPEHTNLSVTLPGRLPELLYRIMSFERHLLAHVDLPTGHSLIALARKPDAAPPAC